MYLSIIKASPAKNTTILVSTPVPREAQAEVARALMEADCAGGEQVCFRERSGIARERMQMMGGEFCINAALSMAACFLREDGGAQGKYRLEASGREGAFLCRARALGGERYVCEVPLEGCIAVEAGGVVRLPGICHQIVEGPPDPRAGERLRAWARREEGAAYGMIFLNGDAARPLVYVPSTDTAVWESACGSGTAAVAALRAAEGGADASVRLAMPGGTLEACARWQNGRVEGVRVRGTVLITLEGRAWIEGQSWQDL